MTRRSRFGRALTAVTAACAVLVLAAACGGEAEPDDAASAPTDVSPELQALITAAQAEGELTWYSVPAESIAKTVSDEFAKKYDIEVKFIRLTSSDLAQRFAGEAETGKPQADLFVGSYTPFIKDAKSKGWTTDLASAGIPDFPGDFPADYLKGEDGTAVVQVQPSGLTVNTGEAGTDQIKDWKDLLDPKWKGKIVMVDPRASAAYTPFWNLMIKENGEDFLTKLKAQEPKLAPSAAPGTQQIAAGEGAILMPGVQSIVEDLKGKGAPVGFVQPAASTGPEIVACLAAKAAHPSAAKLFVHYLMSPEGNKVLNSFPGSSSPRDPATLPAKYTFNADLLTVPSDRIFELLGLPAK